MLARYYVTGWSGRFGMWIAAQDDDSEMLNAMASLTDKHIKMGIYHEQDGIVTRRE